MVDYVDFARVRELPEFPLVDMVYFVQPNAGDPVRQFITGDDAVPVEIAAATAAQQLFDAGLIDAPTANAMAAYLTPAISAGEVRTVEPGQPAVVQNVGTGNDVVLDFDIPAGAAATLAIGTVTTGAPGSSAAIENVGTPGNAVFNITIPRGDPGAPRLADLYIIFGQSLTTGRSPQMTSANAIVASLFTFNGGCEAPSVPVLPLPSQTYPISPVNMAAMVGFVPPAGIETWGPGLGFQSAKAGVPRSFLWVPGQGSMSAKLLHVAHMSNLRHGVTQAVSFLRQAGYEPVIRYVFVHGHADADATDDGNAVTTPTSKADYTLACRKLFATMRLSATQALGYTFTGPIWVTPLLTQNGVASLAARRDIVMAQFEMPSTIPGVRLLPPHSQFANLFSTDLVHPLGAAYRYYAELSAAYITSGLTPPVMVSRSVSAGKVAVAFDQPIKIGSSPDATSPGNSRNGFTVIDNTGAEVAVTATTISGSTVTLTVASTANLTGAWLVRNGLQLLGTLGSTGFASEVMPRTRIAGMIDVGAAQDGTVLENLSVPQEISA